MSEWFRAHPWLTYFFIFFSLVFIFNKVFRVRRLPLLKSFFVYFLIGIGSFIFLMFQLDLQLPIVYSLWIALAMMAVVYVRSRVDKR